MATFLLLCTKTFTCPVNSSANGNIPTPTPTTVVLEELKRIHKKDLQHFKEYHGVNKAVKSKTQAYIPEMFYPSLVNKVPDFPKFVLLPSLLISRQLMELKGGKGPEF